MLWNLFLFCKAQRQTYQKQSWNKFAHTKLSSENVSIAETTTCCAHIDWLLINSVIHMSVCTTKPTKWHAPSDAQSDQCLRCPHEESSGPWLPFERTAKADQTAQMPRLIWVFVGRAGHFVGFVMQYMSDVRGKPVFGVCDQLRLKPACSATETRLGLEISAIQKEIQYMYFYPGSEQQKRWSDCADVHADPVFEISARSPAW